MFANNQQLPVVITGIVIHGHDRGKDLGYPTANINPSPDIAMPKHGIYSGTATIYDKKYLASISVGVAKMFGDTIPKIEAHILDFNEDIYGKTLELTLKYYLRDMIQFDTIDDLISQINQDINQTRLLNKNP